MEDPESVTRPEDGSLQESPHVSLSGGLTKAGRPFGPDLVTSDVVGSRMLFC